MTYRNKSHFIWHLLPLMSNIFICRWSAYASKSIACCTCCTTHIWIYDGSYFRSFWAIISFQSGNARAATSNAQLLLHFAARFARYLLLLLHAAAMSTTGQRQLLARPEAKYANPWPPGHQPGSHQVVSYIHYYRSTGISISIITTPAIATPGF